jgi:hypothetical protein
MSTGEGFGCISGDTDLHGAQQHAPLLDVDIPI